MTSSVGNLKLKISENLRKYRKELGLSQRNFSIIANFSENFIQMLESGKRVPSVDTIEKLAIALKVEPWELLK